MRKQIAGLFAVFLVGVAMLATATVETKMSGSSQQVVWALLSIVVALVVMMVPVVLLGRVEELLTRPVPVPIQERDNGE